ncbi:hypothetical protein L1887_53529 [Cichorium endivia]|nr:hypothetical protein L1887_53529 [Cichorium endivia]
MGSCFSPNVACQLTHPLGFGYFKEARTRGQAPRSCFARSVGHYETIPGHREGNSSAFPRSKLAPKGGSAREAELALPAQKRQVADMLLSILTAMTSRKIVRRRG